MAGRWLVAAGVLAAVGGIAAPSASSAPETRTVAAPPPTTEPLPPAPAAYARRLDVPALTTLGRRIFFDRSLSANGRVACASCHDPAFGYGPPNGLAIQPSGARVDPGSGFRATPALRYLQSVPPYAEHFRDNEGDDSLDKGPTGGFMWDGRAASVREQARLPLLSRSEMGNADTAEVAARLRDAVYADELRRAFGADLFERGPDAAFDAAALALEVFQQSPADFYPYTSRYDAVLRREATLAPAEARGLALFNDAAKGNCASCHPSAPTPDGAFPLFTDFGHIALGLPRNPKIPVDADPRFVDLGLCGPLRTDLVDVTADCGRFRAPSLRNVALRRVFFHNGSITTLEDAIRFYATRDTEPARWYGGGARFDDLPARYHANVNVEPPFGGVPGGTPALTDAEIADVATFLRTLTDRDLVDTTGSPPRR